MFDMRAGELVDQHGNAALLEKIRQFQQRRGDLGTVVFADQGYGFKGIFHPGI